MIGAVTAKGASDRATIVVKLKSGETGFVTVDGQSSAALLGLVTPWLRRHGINLEEPAVGPTLIADELTKLAGLRDSGVLSDDEFHSAKARLLA